MDGWIHPPYVNLGVERGVPVATYIDPVPFFHPERSILRGIKLLGGGLGCYWPVFDQNLAAQQIKYHQIIAWYRKMDQLKHANVRPHMLYILPRLYHGPVGCFIHVHLWPLWPTHLVTYFPVNSTVYTTFTISYIDDPLQNLWLPQLGNSVPVHSTVHPVLNINYGAGILSQGWGQAWN